MARRNDADEIQGRTTKMPKLEPENSRAANQETEVSFTVEDFLDGRCTVADLAVDALREVESLEHERIERGKEHLEQLITRLEMELELEMEMGEEDEYEPEPPVVVLAMAVLGAPPLGLPEAAEPPATPGPGGESRPRY